jgi:hypothetical protein
MTRFAVTTTALGLFLVVFTLLAFQLRAQARPAVAASPPARRVLQRRIVVRKVIVTVRSDAPAAAPARVVSSAPAVVTGPAPVAPAPAPAAPLVSHTS